MTQEREDEGYVVKEGDTLSEIAAEYGATVEDLVELNGLADPDSITPGQVLTLRAEQETSN
jgi:LysM repeat protein